METRIQELLSQMTLEEKIQLTIGSDFWHTHGVERLGVPAIAMNDGPSGLRKPYVGDQLSANLSSIPATCFPSAEALASSWDINLVEEVGQALAQECLANDVQVLLAPGINMKRTPLGGRCFEYYSEDPVLAGELGAAYVRGVQSKGVGTSLKHYACNNQEYERMTISSEVDERTLREIYLAAFERVVKKARPWTVMSSYNKLNGTYASEHPELLRQILKGEWGFEGVVVSDWGAVSDKGLSLAAGLDLEMPGRSGSSPAEVANLVRSGELAESILDEAAGRVLQLIFKGENGRQPEATFSVEEHHALARRAASESLILLKNQDNLLPLQIEAGSRVALLGRFARHPRFKGAGSAQVNPLKVDTLFEELHSLLAVNVSLAYADGYTEDGSLDNLLLQEAVELARSSQVAIIVAGLSDRDESEGFDRPHMDMSEAHNRLIEEVCRVQPNTIVVLCNGSVVTLPWVGAPRAVLEAGLAGQASAGAIADVLLGKVNPSGKLAETFARRLEDTPAYLNYPGEAGKVRYGEGLFIGYRYYEKRQIEPLFPFGYGLSYTTFEYSDLKVSSSTISDEEKLEVTVSVRNSGTRAGKEIVQLYLREISPRVVRPVKELKAFAKVALHAGETREVHLQLEPRDFAFYDIRRHRWSIEAGEFEILIGRSSAEIVLSQQITMNARPLPPLFSKWSTLKEFFLHPQVAGVLLSRLAGSGDVMDSDTQDANLEMVLGLPLIKLVSLGRLTNDQVDDIIAQVNQRVQI